MDGAERRAFSLVKEARGPSLSRSGLEIEVVYWWLVLNEKQLGG